MKTVLITGANTGIGAETAIELARQGFRVVFASRNQEKTEPVMARAKAAGQHDEVHFVPLELDDLDSVRRCANTFLAMGHPLDVLLLNAGLARVEGTTKQGFEPAFGVNHLGHFFLTRCLEPALRRAEGARVVVVASRAHERVKRPLQDEHFKGPSKTSTGWSEYQDSKLANVLFTKELARRWKDSGVTAVCLHPGVIASDLWRNMPWPIAVVATLAMKSPKQGAVSSLRCATRPISELVNGGYYGDDGEPRRPSALAEDTTAAEHLWAASEAFVANH